MGHWAAGIVIFPRETCTSRTWGSFHESFCGAWGPLVALGGQLVMLWGIFGTWGPFVALGDQPVMLRGICGTRGPSVALGGQPVRQCAKSG